MDIARFSEAFKIIASVALCIVLSSALCLSMAASAYAIPADWARSSVDEADLVASLAENPSTDVEQSAGNVFGASEGISGPASGGMVARDFCWAGRNLDFIGLQAGGDILMAGMNLKLADSTAGGSVRMGGMDLSLSNVMAEGNFTLAGQDVSLVSCEALGGVYCAGKNISFNGTAIGASLMGSTVDFSGSVSGDVSITGESITIADDAIVTGTLRVTSSTEPVIPETAQIGGYEFEYTEGATASDAAEAITGAAIFFLVLSRIVGFVGAIIFAIVLAWLFRKPVESAAEMTRSHAGRIFGTGAIAAVAAPVLFFLLMGFVVTSPIAFALLCALVMLTIASVPFAAASFSRLVFPRMNRIGSAAIGGAVLGLASIIPFLGVLVSIAAFIYVAGYAVQAVWRSRTPGKNPASPMEGSPVQEAAVPVMPPAVDATPTENSPTL